MDVYSIDYYVFHSVYSLKMSVFSNDKFNKNENMYWNLGLNVRPALYSELKNIMLLLLIVSFGTYESNIGYGIREK